MNEQTKKKILGQFFTDRKLARLLSHLSFNPKYKSVIDPMCGIGDMLFAYSELTPSALFRGVEIDQSIHANTQEELSKSSIEDFTIYNGNAFNEDVLKQISPNSFDLVITNPPYVRYQTISKNKSDEIPLLDSKQIRKNLLNYSKSFPFDDEKDRELFQKIISSYSGLSDLAVPSWILCSMLTKKNGTLAVIVPDVWLNREYASIIQYLLLRWFKIKYVIEDANSYWFKDAQVKTTLVIAEKINRKESAFKWDDETYQRIAISKNAINEKSIVGNLYPNSNSPEQLFVTQLENNDFNSNDFIQVKELKLSHLAKNLKSKTFNSKWISSLEDNYSFSQKNNEHYARNLIPPTLQNWLGKSKTDFTLLEQLGISVGQGLRTGANDFFYVEIKEKTKKGWKIIPNQRFNTGEILIPLENLKRVLRRQSELGNNLSLRYEEIKNGVLIFQHSLVNDDLEEVKKNDLFYKSYFKVLPNGVSNFIKTVEKTNIGTNTVPKFIPNLSAVAPNVKKWNASKPNIYPKFWYMLPPLKKRHEPDLFIPRINGRLPITFLNTEPKVVIDANFSTLWINRENNLINKYTILAILNSTWIQTLMELTATVMGGGALKLEATHIKSLPIPLLNVEKLNELTELGTKLISNNNITEIKAKIDSIIIEHFFSQKMTKQKLLEINKIKNEKLQQRIK